ncbi:MAG: sulfotransferase, partial [Acidimicrobiales bacterium]|nr:sulfotransferase [Acidimicrobiales bacterium]
LLQHSFASMLFALTCPLPSYNAWLSTTHHEAAYRFACDLLRLNEWRAGRSAGRPRVMKSPQFVLDLAVVSDLFPDAVVAQNHRDPVDLVGSYCSVYARSRARSCERVDPIALGRERLDHLAAMARRSADVRRDAAVRGEAGRYVDVGYERLVAEPLRVVEELYAAAGLDLTSAALAAMEGWLATHPQHAGGRHEYDLAEYGLDRAAVEAALADDIGFLTPGVEE